MGSILTWGSIILAVLRIAEWLIEQGQKHKWISEGEARATAASLARIVEKADYAKEKLNEARGLDDVELDRRLRDLAEGR